MPADIRSASFAARLGIPLIAAVLAASAFAGTTSAATGPYLVRDIKGGAQPSNPTELTPVGSTLFFTAKDAKGRELWKSDGTQAGTVRVKNIRPGAKGSNPHELVDVGGTLFFVANDGAHGDELWSSDGTAAGTAMVEDITPGAGGTSIAHLANAASVLTFFVVEPTHQLWRSDGTPGGTSLVAELPSDGQPPEPLLTIFTTRYFQFSNGGIPTIWTTDGSSENTGPIDYIPQAFWLIYLSGTFYFSHFDGTGIGLWKSNGTPEGIELVKDINPGGDTTGNSNPPIVMNGVMYFTTLDGEFASELWRSDGTEVGTYRLGDVIQVEQLHMARLGNRILFGGQTVDTENELWRTNGTEAGTTLVKRIAPPGSFGSYPHELTKVGSRVYFSADRDGDPFVSDVNLELFRTDGSLAGTKLVADLDPSGGSRPQSLINVGGTLYFTADDEIHGRELWRYVP